VLPNFFVIGAMKSGTTSIHSLLRQHPDIFMSDPKEPDFFSKDEKYFQLWDWYESLFEAAQGKIAIGEASADYTKRGQRPHTAARIAKHIPNAKLIYIVRHPLERIESHWMHGVHEKWCSPNFRKAILEPELIEISRYWWQINAYREYFSDDRILVIFFEDFRDNPQETLTKCFQFLGIEPSVQIANPSRPKNVSQKRISEKKMLTWLKRVPIFETAQKIAPTQIKNSIKPFLIRKITEKPQWHPSDREKVIEQIIDDTHTFLKFYDKPVDYWKLETPHRQQRIENQEMAKINLNLF
jgi:Sulfotransferase domain